MGRAVWSTLQRGMLLMFHLCSLYTVSSSVLWRKCTCPARASWAAPARFASSRRCRKGGSGNPEPWCPESRSCPYRLSTTCVTKGHHVTTVCVMLWRYTFDSGVITREAEGRAGSTHTVSYWPDQSMHIFAAKEMQKVC